MANDPTTVSFQRLLAVQPVLSAIAPLSTLKSSLPERTLFHAGPPLLNPEMPSPPLLNAIAAAIVLEGWANSRATALAAIGAGDVRLASAQDFGIVTPLAFVVGPSTICLQVKDWAKPDHFIVSPLNDGPPPIALRFGTYQEGGLLVVRDLIDGTGADLASALTVPLELLPAMAAALSDGDDLHGQVSVMQQQVISSLPGNLSPRATAYLDSAGQFALNVVMAAAALMIGAGAGVADSNMVIACGGNGEDLGYKLAASPDDWITVPASRPIGPRLPGFERSAALPAIGDSAVIDALGLGAACLRTCPEIAKVLQDYVDRGELHAAFLDDRAHKPFIGPHPALGNTGIRLGLDLTRARDCLGIMLGMVEETGAQGLMGRGIAPWSDG